MPLTATKLGIWRALNSFRISNRSLDFEVKVFLYCIHSREKNLGYEIQTLNFKREKKDKSQSSENYSTTARCVSCQLMYTNNASPELCESIPKQRLVNLFQKLKSSRFSISNLVNESSFFSSKFNILHTSICYLRMCFRAILDELKQFYWRMPRSLEARSK